MERDFWARDKPSSTYSTFEPLSVPSEEAIAVRPGNPLKAASGRLSSHKHKNFSRWQKKSCRDNFWSMCMPYRSAGCIQHVMLQDKLLDYEVSLTFPDHNWATLIHLIQREACNWSLSSLNLCSWRTNEVVIEAGSLDNSSRGRLVWRQVLRGVCEGKTKTKTSISNPLWQ